MTQPTGNSFLIVGASGDIGFSCLESLSVLDVTIGAHCCSNTKRLELFIAENKPKAKIRIFPSDLRTQKASIQFVDEFVKWAGGLDGVIQLYGGLTKPMPWEDLDQQLWDNDIALNLSSAFFVAQAAVKNMKSFGGKIIFTSTASASRGGGKTSLAYGVAKAGIECLTKGLAKDCAQYKIFVNAIAPGFILTKAHTEKFGKTESDLFNRAQMIPLTRAGTPEDVVRVVMFLLSQGGDYITGEILNISGGDWL